MSVQMFSSDFKGTCALCWDSIYPGQMLVEKKMESLGIEYFRNVHAECQWLLVESITNDPELRKYELSTVE